MVHDSSPLMELRGISKRYGNTQALADVTIEVEAAKVTALVGENGAGKSTLVKTMSGVVQPDSGVIRFRGESVSFDGPAAAAAAGIHLVHQELLLLPHRNVVENIFLGHEQRRRFALAWSQMATAAKDALARLGVDLDVYRPVGDLSTANQQLVEIARALLHESSILILDEPTAALPPAETAKLFEVIEQLTAEGTAIVYISHRLDEVRQLAEVVNILKDGQLVATAAASELTTDRMISLMVGRAMGDLFPARGEAVHPELSLEVNGLCDPPAVLEASFSLHRNEIVGLYGLEGHGQDEILACLAGARKPVRGSLRVHGRARPWGAVGKMIRAGLGFVPEDRKTQGLILDLSGVQNITLPILPALGYAGLVRRRREQSTARVAADTAGVRGDLTSTATALSGGNQQKLVLARWIAASSSILLLNQPTRGVDVGSKAEIYRLIRERCTTLGVSALVVSPEILELRGLCDRILVMSRGRLVAELPASASEEAILQSAVSGRAA